MPEPQPAPETVSLSVARRHDLICDRFEEAWRAGVSPRIEHFLSEVPNYERPNLFADLLRLEREFRGLACSPEECRARFPDFVAQIDSAFRATAASPTTPQPPDATDPLGDLPPGLP